MSSSKRPGEVTIFDLLRRAGETLEPMRKRQEAEQDRRAALSPAARKAEDERRANAIAAQEIEALRRRYARLKPSVVHRETWTLEQFAWLLIGEPADERDAWLPYRADAHQRRISEALGSCVPHRLVPVNPSDPQDRWRFASAQLLKISAEKDLGHHRALAETLGLGVPELRGTTEAQPPAQPTPNTPHAARPPSAAASIAPALDAASASASTAPAPQKQLAAKGTMAREKSKRDRRSAVDTFARALVLESDQNGELRDDGVHLTMSGKEFHRQFCARHSLWRDIGKKTIDSDRKAKKIHVREGRPPAPRLESSGE